MKKTKKYHKSTIDIKHIAKLAGLPVTVQEEKIFEAQLLNIIGYIDQIENTADTSQTEPTFNISPNFNMKRDDISGESLNQSDALANSKNTKDGFFVTRGVFEDE